MSLTSAVSTAVLTCRTFNSKPVPIQHEISSTEFSRVTNEDRYLAMVGLNDLTRKCVPGKVLYREEFCGACGVIHDNPDVLDTYTNCPACYSVIRQPSVLRKRYSEITQEYPLEVLFASYGDPFQPLTAVIVTEYVQRMVSAFSTHDRLAIRPRDNMYELFQLTSDPSPNQNKQLRLRYRINGFYSTLILDFTAQHTIPRPFLLMTPKKYFLKITQACYRHPKGLTPTGRMSFDVTEII